VGQHALPPRFAVGASVCLRSAVGRFPGAGGHQGAGAAHPGSHRRCPGGVSGLYTSRGHDPGPDRLDNGADTGALQPLSAFGGAWALRIRPDDPSALWGVRFSSPGRPRLHPAENPAESAHAVFRRGGRPGHVHRVKGRDRIQFRDARCPDILVLHRLLRGDQPDPDEATTLMVDQGATVRGGRRSRDDDDPGAAGAGGRASRPITTVYGDHDSRVGGPFLCHGHGRRLCDIHGRAGHACLGGRPCPWQCVCC